MNNRFLKNEKACQKKLKNCPPSFGDETGRSLTEMLGVLVIIGVLSITGILGYQFALNKYRSSTTIEELTRRALIISTRQVPQKDMLDMTDMGYTTSLNYDISAFKSSKNPNHFWLSLSNVPNCVCKHILNTHWKMPLLIKVNDTAFTSGDHICYDDEDLTNKMDFEFANDLNTGDNPSNACKNDLDCSGCDKCQNERCVATCQGDERCATDYDTGVKICCTKDNQVGMYCCTSKQNNMCCTPSGSCCPWFKPLQDSNGKCYACDYAQQVYVKGFLSRCNVCDNRELAGDVCVLKCPADTPLRDNTGKCFSCDTTVSVLVQGQEQNCALCSNRTIGGQNNYYCVLKCGQGIYSNKPLMDATGVCHSCDETQNFNVNKVEENCRICPNRVLKGSMCTWPCPDEKPLPDNEGGCHACDDPDPVRLYSPDVCAVCPDRVKGGSFNQSCYLPCGQGIYKDKPLPDVMGVCHSCDETIGINVYLVPQNCQICPNRVLEGTQCILPCPVDKPLADLKGVCHSCDDETAFEIGTDTRLCQKKCPNRILEGYWHNYCALPCGQDIMADKPLADLMGNCYSCDDPADIAIGALPQNCAACDNREIVNGYCVLKK